MAEHAYANMDALVETDWVAAHLDDPAVRLIESNEAGRVYASGVLSGAVRLDWRTELQSQFIRDFVTQTEFEDLMGTLGIGRETTVVLYGDRNNRGACYAYWLFKLFGHRDCRIMNGGRAKWDAERRSLTRAGARYPRSVYQAQAADLSIRAFRDQVLAQLYAAMPLVDARSPEEFAGAVVRPGDCPQKGAERAGRIPTARNVPWTSTINPDGTFKTAAELRALYEARDIRPDDPVIAYSRVGARSAHSWFVLHELLGYPQVKNYDGSWTEWGSLVRAPIEREGFAAPGTSMSRRCHDDEPLSERIH